jgi:hypothetical protein
MIGGGITELPGMTTEAERHFRDVYDHLIRISDLINSNDLLAAYVSSGFFGQNFGWLVRYIAGWPAFVLGIGTQIVTVVILMTFFRRRGWF